MTEQVPQATPPQEQQASAAAKYMHRLGRDGSYLELDVTSMKPLFDCAKGEAPLLAKQIVLKAGRLELTEAEHVRQLVDALSKVAQEPETAGMDEQQLGFYAFRRIFEQGLASLASK